VKKVDLSAVCESIPEHWSPRVVAELNGQVAKVAKIKGEFVWHHHEHEDEFFLVLKGQLVIKMPDEDVVLEEGEAFVVPRGVEHKPVAEEEVFILMFEPESTVNTGNVRNEMTILDPEHI
jgi:mannose-6-phosphate isomerase-like protein (cupin superfamily)